MLVVIDNTSPRRNLILFLFSETPENQEHPMSSAQSSNCSFIRSRYIYFTVLLVSLSIPLIYRTAQPYTNSIWKALTTQAASIMSDSSRRKSPSRTPVYFLGIGGP